MPSETYKGHLIAINNDVLLIDDKQIKYVKDDAGRYSSNAFPYSSFSTVHELAQAIIDNK